LDPENSWYRFLLGETLRMTGDLDAALTEFERILSRDPDHTSTLASYAEVLRARFRCAEALECLDRALSVNPSYAFALAAKGALLVDCGEYEQAHICLEEATTSGENEAWHYFVDAIALMFTGRLDDAHAAVGKAVELAPDDGAYHILIGNILFRKERVEEARVEYQWFIDHTDDRDADAADLGSLAWCCYRLDDLERALDYSQQSVSRERNLIWPQFDLGLILMASGRHSLGVREYERGMELISTIEPWRRKGFLIPALQDLDDAGKMNPSLRDLPTCLEIAKTLRREIDDPRTLNTARRHLEVDDGCSESNSSSSGRTVC
jgi:tetratricopeptide (TPR) repeat protein